MYKEFDYHQLVLLGSGWIGERPSKDGRIDGMA
jgi:hypothetical protein